MTDIQTVELSTDFAKSRLYDALKEFFITGNNGVLSLAISSDVTDVINRSTDNKMIRINGGSAHNKGGYVMVYGKDYIPSSSSEVLSGSVQLVAGGEDRSIAKTFSVFPDGRLVFDKQNIVRSINGKTATNNGNINISIPSYKNYVELTKEEFDALEAKDSKTLYNVIDE